MVGPRPGRLRGELGGLLDDLGGQRLADQRLAPPVAAMVDPPTPVSAIPALVTLSPVISMATATPTVAKSPTRRSSLR